MSKLSVIGNAIGVTLGAVAIANVALIVVDLESMKASPTAAAAAAAAAAPSQPSRPLLPLPAPTPTPFDLQACIEAATPLYASPDERLAVCEDMRAGA